MGRLQDKVPGKKKRIFTGHYLIRQNFDKLLLTGAAYGKTKTKKKKQEESIKLDLAKTSKKLVAEALQICTDTIEGPQRFNNLILPSTEEGKSQGV